MGVNEKQTALDPAPPARRPIPLPPSSLRPPPRAQKSAPFHPEPAARVPAPSPEPEPGALGTRRGFWVGLALPVVGLGIAALLWWIGEGGLDRGSPAAGPAPLEVRTRMTETPRQAAPGGVPTEAVSHASPGGSPAVPSAAAPDRSPAPAGPAPEFTVQVGSYRTRAKAERVLASVRDRTGLRGVVLDSEVDGVAWHRILLGAFATPREALEAVRPLTAEHEVMVRPLPERWIDALSGSSDAEVEGGVP